MAGTLLLVDGMAVIYRAFHAIPPFTTKSGISTNATFGFIRMLKQALSSWNPTHIAVALDGGLSAEKLALLSEYKAQRPPTPDALKSQIPDICEYLDHAGIKWLRQEGQEADDIISSLAERGRAAFDKILIASGDKDLFQLVGGNVFMIGMSSKQASITDAADVKAKTGVEPGQIIDWLALTGDNSDNIPGVPGIGAKTAASLLTEFGSWSELVHRIFEVKNDRIRNLLVENTDVVGRNRKMVMLAKDLLPCLNFDDLQVKPPEIKGLLAFYERLEFHAMAREIREPELF